MKLKLVAAVAALSLAVTALPVVHAREEFATRGQIADMLLLAADDYSQGLVRSDIIKGYPDGSVNDQQYVTRAESFVMISRAFGALEAPVGNNLRLMPQNVQYTDVPQWAREETENLIRGGVVVGTGDNLLSPDENVTKEQVETIIRRIFTLKGSNLKDDFYSAVNKTQLDQSTIRPGEMAGGGFNDLVNLNSDRLTKIITEMAAAEHEKGSKEQKVADLYHSILDYEQRDKAGIAPIKEYLDAVGDAGDLAALYSIELKMRNELGMVGILDFVTSVDSKDSTKYVLYFTGVTPSLTKDIYAQNGEKKNLYTAYLAKLLEMSGEESKAAAENAQAYFELEKTLSENQLERQEYGDVDKVYNVYTPQQLQDLFPAADIARILKDAGFSAPSRIIVQDEKMTRALAAQYTEENLALLKTVVKLRLLINYGGVLGRDFETAATQFQSEFFGTEGTKSDEENASLTVQNIMSDYLGALYVEQYFSPEAKKDVEEMVGEFIEIYKKRISALDWMSGETKAMAAKKLDTMTVKIGYPDRWDSQMDAVEILSPKDGGTYFGNVCAISRAGLKANAEQYGKPVDKSKWLLAAYTVNAYYNATSNEIVFPAGILQAPFYDLNASREENLGGIGTVIAHEITHAFDNNGAKYDENGNAANWWTSEDYTEFQQLCKQVVAYYDGVEAAPGVRNNGTQTLSENIADIGGMACALEAAALLEAPDYDKFFRNYAAIWMITCTRDYQEMLAQLDLHSANKIRTNRTVASFQQFYDTYGISEKDGMYVPPQERVSIW